MSNANKIFLITGASGGFGRAFAEVAVEAGHTVVGTVRREDDRVAFEALHRTRTRAVVLDVTRVRRVDESGAVALAQLWARLRNDGVFCRVRGLHPVLADSPIELLLFIRSTGARVLSGLLLPVPCAS